jgi:hypothetical protein
VISNPASLKAAQFLVEGLTRLVPGMHMSGQPANTTFDGLSANVSQQGRRDTRSAVLRNDEKSLLMPDRLAAWGGGFPIKVDGEIVGAIGLSGAPTVQNDVDCAKAALALIPDPVRAK